MLFFLRQLYHNNRKEARASSSLYILYLPWLDVLAVAAVYFLLTNPDQFHSRKPAFAFHSFFSLLFVSSVNCSLNGHIDSVLPSSFLLVLKESSMLQEEVYIEN